MENLANLQSDFDIYDRWGFRDSVNVDTGVVSGAYLSLDQGIIMAAIGNALADDILRESFATKEFRKVLQPVIGHGDVQRRAAGAPCRTSTSARRSRRSSARIAWFETLGASTERDRPAPDVALPPPTEVHAERGRGQVTVSWSPVDGAAGYLVHRRLGRGDLEPIDHRR